MVCDLIKSQQSWAVLGLPCVFWPKQVAQPSAEGRYWPMCMLALGLFTLRTCKCKAHSSLLHCAPSESWLKCRQDCSFNISIYRVWINLPAYFHVTDLGTSQLGEGVSVLWGHCWRWEIIAFFLRFLPSSFIWKLFLCCFILLDSMCKLLSNRQNNHFS